MALDCEEVQEITELSQATLLNLGVPDRSRLEACILAGRRANEMGHPVVLDPVGAGASRFRREGIRQLLAQVRIDLIRCNQEEARAVLEVAGGKASEELQPELRRCGEHPFPERRAADGDGRAACPRLRLYCSGERAAGCGI